MLSLLRLERKQKDYSNLFRTSIFLFLFHSFKIETVNTFTNSRISLENHTRFQTKMVSVCTGFQIKTAQKPYPRRTFHLLQFPWNSCFFWFTQLENSWDKRKFWKGSPVFPAGTFRMDYKFLEFRTNFRLLAERSTIARTTNMASSQQMGDCTSVHAAVITLQFWKYS